MLRGTTYRGAGTSLPPPTGRGGASCTHWRSSEHRCRLFCSACGAVGFREMTTASPSRRQVQPATRCLPVPPSTMAPSVARTMPRPRAPGRRGRRTLGGDARRCRRLLLARPRGSGRHRGGPPLGRQADGHGDRGSRHERGCRDRLAAPAAASTFEGDGPRREVADCVHAIRLAAQAGPEVGLVGAHAVTSSIWTRTVTRARLEWLLTVPTVQPRTAAVCASVRSS
jgi:hypothetical protein